MTQKKKERRLKEVFIDPAKNLVAIFPDGTERRIGLACKEIDYYVIYPEEKPNFIEVRWREERNNWTYHYEILYYIDFDKKEIRQVAESNGRKRFVNYNSRFVVYENYEKRKYEIKDLRTGEIHTLPADSFVHFPKIGYRYFFQEGNLYDLKRKKFFPKPAIIKHDGYMVSDDFLNGKTPFYYATNRITKDKEITPNECYIYHFCTIYHKDKVIKQVKGNRSSILNPYLEDKFDIGEYNYEKHEPLFRVYNSLITKETRYLSDIDNEKGVIRFYKLTKNSLEFVNELQVNKQYFYEIHLTSCGNKFVIFELTDFGIEVFRDYLDNNDDDDVYIDDDEGIYIECVRTIKSREKIFLYDVIKGEIEYENKVCDFDFSSENGFKYLLNLLLYAHGFQDFCFHAEEMDDDIELIPMEEWRKTQNLRKVAKEIAKAFCVPKQEPQSPKLVI